MQPRGINLYRSGELEKRAQRARGLLKCCSLCPRQCGVNRLTGETGVCQIADKAVIASYNPHFGEEQPLVGSNGSGTIFLSGCNLKCCFCQNYDISHDPASGVEVEANQFAQVMLDLQGRGCHNINFVTPTHVVPQILEALLSAYEKGLRLPLVYNCSGYESTATLKLLDGVFDIYMPDVKFWNSESARRYADAEDYPEVTREALVEMFRQVGDLRLDREGIAVQGLLIRHLLMPAALDETREILAFIAARLSTTTYVNIMDQYRPCGDCSRFEELRTTISTDHYRQALSYADEAGLIRIDQRDLQSLLRRLGITF